MTALRLVHPHPAPAPASGSGSGSVSGSANPTPRRGNISTPVWAAGAFALLLGLLWAREWAAVGGDLAAQWAWADFGARHPSSAYDLAWYGGMHPASYSVLAPGLMGRFGVRTVAVAAATASAVLLAVLVRRTGIRQPLPVALWGAFALSCNVIAGLVTFALGTLFALAALVAAGTQRAVRPWRTVCTAVLALLTTLASPVAGLFVEVAAAALLLTGRRSTGWALALPPPLVVLTTSLLFPFYGIEPMQVHTAALSSACGVAVALLAPRAWRAVRIGGGVYTVGVVLSWALPTPIGSNVQRLALLFAAVLFLAALCARPPSLKRTAALLAAFAMTAFWTIDGNIVELPTPTSARQAAGLVAELHLRHADAGRVEAVPMLNHWEAWGLASTVDLARGWNRQLDVERNSLFYDGTLTAAGYHAWLQRWSVSYVVLPEGEVDPSATAERALIRSAPSWLEQVWHDQHWRLYHVLDARPLAEPPATVERADAAHLLLTVHTAGSALVRIPWSPWLAAHGPDGACLTRVGDWTRLTAPTPGSYRIDAPYTWPRGTPC